MFNSIGLQFGKLAGPAFKLMDKVKDFLEFLKEHTLEEIAGTDAQSIEDMPDNPN